MNKPKPKAKKDGASPALSVTTGSAPSFRVFRIHEGARRYTTHFAVAQQAFSIMGTRTLGESKWMERQLLIALTKLASSLPNTKPSGA